MSTEFFSKRSSLEPFAKGLEAAAGEYAACRERLDRAIADLAEARRTGASNIGELADASDLAVTALADAEEKVARLINDARSNGALDSFLVFAAAQKREPQVGFFDIQAARALAEEKKKTGQTRSQSAPQAATFASGAPEPGIKIYEDGSVAITVSKSLFDLAYRDKTPFPTFYFAASSEGLSVRQKKILNSVRRRRCAEGDIEPVDPLPDQRSGFSIIPGIQNLGLKISVVQHLRKCFRVFARSSQDVG